LRVLSLEAYYKMHKKITHDNQDLEIGQPK
jgi:hypothetical protein